MPFGYAEGVTLSEDSLAEHWLQRPGGSMGSVRHVLTKQESRQQEAGTQVPPQVGSMAVDTVRFFSKQKQQGGKQAKSSQVHRPLKHRKDGRTVRKPVLPVTYLTWPYRLLGNLNLQFMIAAAAAAAAKSLQSFPTLCDPIDGSPPGSPVPGVFQARTLEWVAISFSNAWKWKVEVKWSVVFDSSRPHGLQPIRLLRPWDFPGNSTGVGCRLWLSLIQSCGSQFSLNWLSCLTENWERDGIKYTCLGCHINI